MKGFSLLGAIITVGIAGALSLSIPILVSSNISLKTTELQSRQAYYSARAALEYAERQIRVDGNPPILPSKSFMGVGWTFTRSNNTVQISTGSGSASNSFSITDPNPATQAACLVVDVSGGNFSGKKLNGIVLSRTAACNTSNTTLTIVSMTVSWTLDSSYLLKKIRLDGSNYYNSGSGLGSGSLFTFSSNYVINNSSTHSLDYVQWSSIDSSSTVTMVFHFSDGSASTAVFTGSGGGGD